MRKKSILVKKITLLGLLAMGGSIGLLTSLKVESVEATTFNNPTHIGTFEGSTTFATTSRNGINPGLFIEVMDDKGTLRQYESEEGLITIPDTKEGAYVTQAKLLGKTKYVDQDTGEILDQWEVGRNLRLESSEMPALQIHGVNMVNPEEIVKGTLKWGNDYNIFRDSIYYTNTGSDDGIVLAHCIPVEPNTKYYISYGVDAHLHIMRYDKEGNHHIGRYGWGSNGKFFTTAEDEYYINIYPVGSVGGWNSEKRQIMKDTLLIAKSDTPIPYEPYQSNTLTTDEDTVLRGVGNFRDTLDLITGEFVKSVAEMTLNGDEYWAKGGFGAEVDGYPHYVFQQDLKMIANCPLLTDQYKYINFDSGWKTYRGVAITSGSGYRRIMVRVTEDTASTLDEFKTLLHNNPITLQYVKEEKVTKTTNLKSTYRFKPVSLQNIEVNGSIEPLIVSIKVPTESLSFTIDPNQEDDQQFIAPDFTLTNETFAPLQVELKTFEQTSDVLNDVLPDAHENWEGLNQTQSRDIALALVPNPSDGWLSLHEDSYYVANVSNDFIGTVKGKSSVGFSFNALHGQSFSEVLNPQYRLSFVFGFHQ